MDLRPQRLEGETFEDYRARRGEGKRLVQLRLKGRFAHVSARVAFVDDNKSTRDLIGRGHLRLRGETVTADGTVKLICTEKGTTYVKPK